MYTREVRIRIRIGEVLFVVLVALGATSGLTADDVITLAVSPSTTVATGSSLQLYCFWLATPTSDSSLVSFQRTDSLGWFTFAKVSRQNYSLNPDYFYRSTVYYNSDVGNVSFLMLSLNWTYVNDTKSYRCQLQSGQTSDPVDIRVEDAPTNSSSNISNSLTFVSPSAAVESGNTVNFICAWFANGSRPTMTVNMSRLNSTGSWVSLGSFTVDFMTTQTSMTVSRLITYAYYTDGLSYMWFRLLQSQVSDTGTYQCLISDGRSSNNVSINVVPATTATSASVTSTEPTGLALYVWVIIGAGAFLAIVLVVVLVVCKVKYNFKPRKKSKKPRGKFTGWSAEAFSQSPLTIPNNGAQAGRNSPYANNERHYDIYDNSYGVGSMTSDYSVARGYYE